MQAWYPIMRADALRHKPVARRLLDTPLCVYRTPAGPAAVLDRCPHRNAPLTMGSVIAGELQCAYHGWRFGENGAVRHIPGLALYNEPRCDFSKWRVPSFATLEQDGLIWVYGCADAKPEAGGPYHFKLREAPGYATASEVLMAPASVKNTAENALDVIHTAYLHKGLFRQGSAKPIPVEVNVQRTDKWVEAHYVGERRPTGLLAKLLAPEGGEVEHVDRFILPSIVEVEYRLGSSHILAAAALSPVTEHETLVFSNVSLRLARAGAASFLAKALRPFALKIFAQDVHILREQTAIVREFEDESFRNTPVDVMGTHIQRLLRTLRSPGKTGTSASPGETLHFQTTLLI